MMELYLERKSISWIKSLFVGLASISFICVAILLFLNWNGIYWVYTILWVLVIVLFLFNVALIAHIQFRRHHEDTFLHIVSIKPPKSRATVDVKEWEEQNVDTIERMRQVYANDLKIALDHYQRYVHTQYDGKSSVSFSLRLATKDDKGSILFEEIGKAKNNIQVFHCMLGIYGVKLENVSSR